MTLVHDVSSVQPSTQSSLTIPQSPAPGFVQTAQTIQTLSFADLMIPQDLPESVLDMVLLLEPENQEERNNFLNGSLQGSEHLQNIPSQKLGDLSSRNPSHLQFNDKLTIQKERP